MKTLTDMYMKELPEHCARKHENFKFVVVLSEQALEDR